MISGHRITALLAHEHTSTGRLICFLSKLAESARFFPAALAIILAVLVMAELLWIPNALTRRNESHATADTILIRLLNIRWGSLYRQDEAKPALLQSSQQPIQCHGSRRSVVHQEDGSIRGLFQTPTQNLIGFLQPAVFAVGIPQYLFHARRMCTLCYLD